MNCEETQELVDAYVDRELDLAKSLELERHLSECDACSKRHDSASPRMRGALFEWTAGARPRIGRMPCLIITLI